MRLPRELHGNPQSADPPFDLSIFDIESGQKVAKYEPGKIYRVKLEAYVHFRGLMLQTRLCTSRGEIIGTLRGGKFIEDEQWEAHGLQFHQCGRLHTNDSLTHTIDDKKFLAETKWTTARDIGNVQFVATIATENQLYWEKWRPRSSFLLGPNENGDLLKEELFLYNNQNNVENNMETEVKASEYPLFEEQQEFLKEKNLTIFEVDKKVFGISDGEQEGSGILAEEEPKSSIFTSKFTEDSSQVTAFMVGRIFKKFAPINDTILREDDLRFLNNHNVQHDFVDLEEEKENGSGNENEEEEEVKKLLKEEIDPVCISNYCQNNSTCIPNSSPNSAQNYTCQCQNDYHGEFCDRKCPEDFCKKEGICYLKPNTANFACKCVPGTTGKRCQIEINECDWKKCQNDAKCTDIRNGYICECADGFMGKNCERKCSDIYGSCKIWRREGQCEFMREQTDFFDVNCAESCGICRQKGDLNSNLTEVEPLSPYSRNYIPLQPILYPFHWLLGEWKTSIKGYNNHTTDYPIDLINTINYNETLTISVIPSLMFGTSYLNYSSEIVSEDLENSHISNGFITIQQYKQENLEENKEKGAMTTVSNTGLIMIEEGEIIDRKDEKMFVLTPTYVYYHKEENLAKKPEKMKRWFTIRNNRLLQYMVREFKGRTHKFTKIYEKTKDFEFL
ncbi:unnamed protein product [Caenorhabditis angaria]|uniref:EGF-like domain-containing protein n=1 Tax=Caenorhabditis angaria TaxID=860376 RepID=A0A9P1N0B2_9PELO|nr:unnamed protein product [Caenorhabditis angaria]